MSVYRCFVEKKQPFATEANGVKSDLKIALLNDDVKSVRVINRYDLENIDEEDLDEWKTKATYYDSDEICNIMIDILADPEADWLARNQAISVILTIGSDAQKEKLKSTVEGLTDDEASYLQEQYAEAIEES